MTALETRDRLMTDEAFVFSELKRLQFLYGLKFEMRYGEKRDESGADSVAEHLYGMQIAFHYFWPLVDLEGTWDKAKMMSMITWHDIEEVVVGDTIGYDKTPTHKEAEAEALKVVFENLPGHMQQEVKKVLEEYDAKQTAEAKFVKAIDKIEPVIHLFNPVGKDLLHRMGTTYEQNASIKVPYFADFPIIMRFYQVCASKMKSEGYFIEPA